MVPVRALFLAGCAVLCCAILSTLRTPSEHRNAEVEAAPAPALAGACDADDCGCRHEVVAADCCCARGARLESEARVPRARLDPREAVASAADRAAPGRALPASTLESFRCSGGRRGHASAEMRVTPAASTRSAASSGIPPERSWTPRNESAPLYDLRAEPRIPPPRRLEPELG